MRAEGAKAGTVVDKTGNSMEVEASEEVQAEAARSAGGGTDSGTEYENPESLALIAVVPNESEETQVIAAVETKAMAILGDDRLPAFVPPADPPTPIEVVRRTVFSPGMALGLLVGTGALVGVYLGIVRPERIRAREQAQALQRQIAAEQERAKKEAVRFGVALLEESKKTDEARKAAALTEQQRQAALDKADSVQKMLQAQLSEERRRVAEEQRKSAEATRRATMETDQRLRETMENNRLVVALTSGPPALPVELVRTLQPQVPPFGMTAARAWTPTVATPAGTRILTLTPTLRFAGSPALPNPTVTLTTAEGKVVPLKREAADRFVPAVPLTPGQIYQWHIEGTANATTYRSASFRFQTLTVPETSDLATVRRSLTGNPQALAVYLTRQGLFDDAEALFRLVLKSDPKNTVASEWLRLVTRRSLGIF